MQIARFQMPDGRVARFEVPDGTTPEQATQMMQAHFQTQDAAPEEKQKGLAGATLGDVGTLLKNEVMGSAPVQLGMGLARGAKDVIDTGAELLATGYDKLTGSDQQTLSGLVTGQQPGEAARVRAMNKAGVADYEAATKDQGWAAPIGRIGGNVAATLPATSLAGAGLVAGGLPRLGKALASGGMTTGAPVAGWGANAMRDLAIRSAGGAGAGAIQAGAASGSTDTAAGDATTGAVIGGILPGALKVAGAGGKLVGDTWRGATKNFTKSGAEQQGAEVMRKLGVSPSLKPEEIVIGSQPTLSQAMGTSEVARLEKALAARNASFADDLRTRGAEQNLARWTTMNRVTGTTDDIASAEAAREAKAIPILESAMRNAKKPDIQALLDVTDMVGGGSTRLRSNASSAIASVRDKIAQSKSADDLYAVRKEIDDMLAGRVGSEQKGAKFAAEPLMSLKGSIDEALNKATNGKFAKYIEKYTELSKPINRMEAAQKLTDRFQKAAPDAFGQPTITPPAFRMAMGAPDELMGKKMTQGTKLGELMDIGNYGLIEDVGRDLQRQEITSGMGRVLGGGSDTFQNALSDNKLLSMLKMVPKPTGTGGVTNSMLDKGSELLHRRPMAILERAAMDPKFAAELAALPPAQKNRLAQLVMQSQPALYRAAPLMANR